MQNISEIKGIKCDTKGCNYSDDNVKFTEYKDWVNKPCPKCQGNLLTEADYNLVLQMEKISHWKIIRFIVFVETILRKIFRSKMKTKSFTMDGSGKLIPVDEENKK